MEELSIAIFMFLIISIIFLPFEKIFPRKDLHKLIVLLNQKSYTVEKKKDNSLFDKILYLSSRIYKRLNIKLESSKYELHKNKLILAGLSERVSPEQFVGMKILGVISGFSYFFLMFLLKPELINIFMLIFGCMLFYLLPDSMINIKIKKRKIKLEQELPNVLNSMAIVTDAGLNLNEAIKMICEVKKGVLVNELKKVMEEINMGIMQKEALMHLSDRCQVNEITLFTFTLIQSIEKGASGVTLVLNEQAKEVWQKRKNKSKEIGQKATIKLFMSMLLLVFPCLMVFLLGPAIISIIQFFNK